MDELFPKVVGDVVFDEELGAGGGRLGVGRHLGELVLDEVGIPAAAESVEDLLHGWSVKLFDHVGARGIEALMGSGSMDEDDFGTDVAQFGGCDLGGLDEADQDLVEVAGSASHEVVHAYGTAMREGIGQIGRDHE